jgi:arylsulfatase A-like enzyme
VARNVILIVLDTARADAFEPYGAAPGASPAIQQLADRGAVHEAFATAPWTIPSHAAMFGGILPRAAGMPRPDPQSMIASSRAAMPALRQRWLPTVLTEHGYATAAISANPLVSPATGFDMGFARFEEVQSQRWCAGDNPSASGWLTRKLTMLRASTDDGAAQAEQILGEWIADPARSPFFWFINLMECHTPYYLPPLPLNPLPPWDRLRAGREANRHLRHTATWRASCGAFDVPAAALARMRVLYAAAVRLVDSWIARLLDSLDRHRLLDDTTIVVTSDHGENLGEGQLLGHIFSLDDRLIRVPFVVCGQSAPIPGPRFSQVDLAAWIAATCGIDDHPWREQVARDVAVAQLEAPAPADDARVEMLVQAWDVGEIGRRRLTDRLTCATNGRRKLVQRNAMEELYDLEADPLEDAPLGIGSPGARRFDEEVTALRAALREAEAEVPLPLSGPVADLSPSELAHLEQQMRQLGYL